MKEKTTILSSINLTKSIDYLIKVLILSFFFWILYSHLIIENKLSHLQDIFYFSISKIILFTLVLLLMIANWAVEAYKWKYLLASFNQISFKKAFKAVIGGLTIAVVTPARLGEIGGRVLFLKKNRIKSLIISFIGSISQLIITLIFGIAALIAFAILHLNLNILALMLIPFSIWLLLFAFFNFNKIYQPLLRFRLTNRIGRIIKVSTFYKLIASKAILYNVLFFSALRYIIFAVQYLLLLKIFGLQIDVLQSIIMVGSIFLLQSIIPTPAIAELGIRNGIAVFLFSFVTVQLSSVVAAATTIWIVNLLLPALFGSFFVVRQGILKAKGL